jgi:hypothetical protein
VVDTDAMAAGTAMQDMSAITLGAMQSMRLAVSDGWTQMLTDTQAAQSGMLTDTTSKQFSMRDITAQQQEQMRAIVLGKQTESRTAVSTEQETMRRVMAEKQTQMRDKNRTEFESMRVTTGEKLTSMRSSADTTMVGFRGDYDSHMGSLKRINRDGHTSMEDASEVAFKGIRSGMNTQMREARPELGGRMNNLIDVLSKFTSSVNKAWALSWTPRRSSRSRRVASCPDTHRAGTFIPSTARQPAASTSPVVRRSCGPSSPAQSAVNGA